MMQERLHKKRLKIIKCYLGDIADMDLGAGKRPKGILSVDLNRDNRPDVVADIQCLPFREGIINSVVCSHVVEHVSNLAQAMNQINRILSSEGKALFFIPNDDSRLWRIIKPLWTIYYEKFVCKTDSPRTHVHSLHNDGLNRFLVNFDVIQVKKINLGMEIFYVAKVIGHNHNRTVLRSLGLASNIWV